jgi:hypothetical protein
MFLELEAASLIPDHLKVKKSKALIKE